MKKKKKPFCLANFKLTMNERIDFFKKQCNLTSDDKKKPFKSLVYTNKS